MDGHDPVRCDLGQRLKNKSTFVQARVRNRETGFVDDFGIDQQQVEVESAWHPAGGLGSAIPAPGLFDAVQLVEQVASGELRGQQGNGVEVGPARIISGATNGGGFSHRGSGDEAGLGERRQSGERGNDVRTPVAEVGADRDGDVSWVGQGRKGYERE